MTVTETVLHEADDVVRRLQKLFDKKLGAFKPTLKCVWTDGNYEELV